MVSDRIDVYLVCNAKYHDTNFARLELLKRLAEQEDVWVGVADSFADIEAEGDVLYLTLGHCTGKYDMQPLMEVAPLTRCAWNYDVFYDLFRRGIRWGIGASA
jgi:hypothetical protein